MIASWVSRQFCTDFGGRSGATDEKIGAKMTENQPRAPA